MLARSHASARVRVPAAGRCPATAAGWGRGGPSARAARSARAPPPEARAPPRGSPFGRGARRRRTRPLRASGRRGCAPGYIYTRAFVIARMPAKAAAGGAAAADAEPRKAEPKTAEKSSERGAAAEKEKEKAPEAAAGAADGDSNKAAPPDIAAIIAQKAMEGVLAQPAVAVGGTTGCGMQDAAAALAAQAEAAALAERQASAIAPPPSGRAGLKLDRSANRPTGSRRLRWSVAEEQALRDGIAKFGLGKWRAIQKDPNFGPILTIRSNGDLKDKWRNLCKEEAKVAKVAQIGDQRKAADKAASAAASAGADGNAYVAAAPTSDGEASAGEGAQEAGDGYDEHGLDAEGLSKYERERLARIAANHARMEAMLGHSLRAAEVAAAASKPKARARPRKRAKRSEGEEPAQLLRRSARRCAQALPPRDARELTLETLRAAEQGAALEIYWPEDATWYDATLTVARPETNEWDIRYPEDGVEETLRLSDPELPPVRPRGCAAAVSNAAQGDALLPEELTMAEHSRAVCAAADARGAQVASMTTIGSHSVATMRANGQLEVWTLPADGMDRGAIRISGTRVPGYNTEERFVACKIGASECGSFVAVGNGVGDTYVYAVDVPGMPKQVGHAPANKRARSPVVAATITGRGTRVLSASGKGFIWRYEPDPGETKKITRGAWAGQL